MTDVQLPRFFRLRQSFPRPKLIDLGARVYSQLDRILATKQPRVESLEGQRVAIAVGSRGIASLAEITKSTVGWLLQQNAKPFIVPAMGSHGGGTAEGQSAVLDRFGINQQTMGCPIHSSLDVIDVCQAAEGFPVYFGAAAAAADQVLMINRIKPHTRFAGAIESGLMKMMLIGLGKRRGAETYHQAIVQYSFDTIVRSVASEVIHKCRLLGGLAVLENGCEETADIVGLAAEEIESNEPALLGRVKAMMPGLPFDKAELLIVDRIGKDISGTGLDTNIVGRKQNDHAALGDETPRIHHIYVRDLTEQTHGNATGIGIAELCHRQVIKKMDVAATQTNCITAGHVTGAMIPIDFADDRTAIEVACRLAGWVPPEQVSAMWIRDTLSLTEVECSESFYEAAQSRPELEVLNEPSPLLFDETGDLISRHAYV